MKRLLKFRYLIFFNILLLTSSGVHAQSSIVYGYDANGNRTSKTLSAQRSSSINLPINEIEFKKQNEEEIKGLEDIKEVKSSVKIYPNPTSGIIRIELDNYSDPFTGQYQLYDLSGTILKHSRIDSPITEVNMNNISNGMYVLRITINESVLDYKVIKQN